MAITFNLIDYIGICTNTGLYVSFNGIKYYIYIYIYGAMLLSAMLSLKV